MQKQVNQEKLKRGLMKTQIPLRFLPIWPRLLLFCFFVAMICGIGCLFGAYSYLAQTNNLANITNETAYANVLKTSSVNHELTLSMMMAAAGILITLGCSLGLALIIFLSIWVYQAFNGWCKVPERRTQMRLVMLAAFGCSIIVTIMFFVGILHSNIVVEGAVNVSSTATAGQSVRPMRYLGGFTTNPAIFYNWAAYCSLGIVFTLLTLWATWYGIKYVSHWTHINPIVIAFESDGATPMVAALKVQA